MSFDGEHLAAFKEEYEKKGRDDLKAQIPHLIQLADSYAERYTQTNNWTDCVKVRPQCTEHTLLNLVSKYISNLNLPLNRQPMWNSYQK